MISSVYRMKFNIVNKPKIYILAFAYLSTLIFS